MSPAPRLAEVRGLLREGRETLQRDFEAQGNPERLIRRLSALMDSVLAKLWNKQWPGCLVAVGGYGRRELFPYSDVDVLILAAGDERGWAEGFIQDLWDIGLEPGHAVRTVQECVDEAGKDVSVLTNLLEARFLGGQRGLFDELGEAVTQVLNPKVFFEAKITEQSQRHQRFHDIACRLEPNLKESPGGLRDLQAIRWLALALFGNGQWKTLVDRGLMTEQSLRDIRRQELFLKTLRIRLHYLAGRREDRLLFDYQDNLAKAWGIEDAPDRRAGESLMQRYYRAAQRVSYFNELVCLEMQDSLRGNWPPRVSPSDPGFLIVDGRLELSREDLFRRDPYTILWTFWLLARHTELRGLGPKALRALPEARRLVNRSFREAPRNRKIFLDILRHGRRITATLRRMNRYGILGRYLPAFGRIVGQMQHDLFHVYTVDEHTLFVIRNLERFMRSEYAHEFPLCSRLIHGFEDPAPLFIAALFHDIAKGRGGDHSTLGAVDARRFCIAHGLNAEDTDLVAWLVEKHLVMSATAQKQDVSDPAVIERFAEEVGSNRRLAALYLLTVADIRGTSPKVWNAWKGKLLQDLYRATSTRLAAHLPNREELLHSRREQALTILRQFAIADSAPENLWRQLDEGYFLRHDAQDIAWHARILGTEVSPAQPVVRTRLAPGVPGLQVLVYCPDADNLFYRICSIFERMGFTIAEARIHTTHHGYAMETFSVLDEDNKIAQYRDFLGYVEYELARQIREPDAAASGPMTPRLSRMQKHFPITPQVHLAPDERGQCHILTFSAGDRPGLLSRVAQVFARHEIRLLAAKITTLGERAEDSFVIGCKDNRLNNVRNLLALERDITEALRP